MSRADDAPRLARDNVAARYVGGANYDAATGQINGGAFERTPKDTDGVSFTRRGVLAQEQAEDRAAIRRVVGSGLKLGKTAMFAELKVGAALDVLHEFEQDVFFIENPLSALGTALANPAHALLIGFPFKGEAVGSLESEVAGDRLRSCVHDQFAAVA